MSEWSKKAAIKLKQKQADDYQTRRIIEDNGPSYLEDLGKMFDTEAGNINKDAHSNELTCNFTFNDDSFEVRCKGTNAHLRIRFNKNTHRITIDGGGGCTFKEEIAINANLSVGTPYFVNAQGDSTEMENIVHGALDALLGI